MAIPDDETIKRELLSLLLTAPRDGMFVGQVYEELARLHPELTEEERTQRYRRSKSKWANRVQFARLHLANDGLLYKENENMLVRRGYWSLTPEGLAAASRVWRDDENAALKQLQSDVETIENDIPWIEGKKDKRLISRYERIPELRSEAISIHGAICKGCGFNFESTYGIHGRGFIEVHHVVPLATMIEPSAINQYTDLTVLCANCHRMVHRNRGNPLSMRELRDIMTRNIISM